MTTPNEFSAASDPKLSLAAAVNLINGAQRIAAATHINPDPDAIGSLLGFGHLMRAMGKDIVLLCDDPAPRSLHFLPGAYDIQTAISEKASFDLFVGLDASDPDRLGNIGATFLASGIATLVIDHHITNTGFGRVNLVDSQWSATAEGLVDLASALGVGLTTDAAACMLAGLVGDTRSFSTTSTTPHSLKTAATLMEAGGDIREISEMLFNRREFGTLALWGLGLSKIVLDGSVIWTFLPYAERQAQNLVDINGSGLSNLLVSAEEANIAAVFTEQANGIVDASFRARPGFDVAAIALSLGGGGHPAAAGVQLPGPLAETANRVVSLLQQEAARTRGASA